MAAAVPLSQLAAFRAHPLTSERLRVRNKSNKRAIGGIVLAQADSSGPRSSTAASCRRRDALTLACSLAALPLVLAQPAIAAENPAVVKGLSKYIKKKQLDPLGSYVPLLLEARDQLIRTGRVMLQDASAARELLRSGAFNGLRDNVRAVGQYAAEAANSREAGDKLVNGFFQTLQDFDYVLSKSARAKEPLAVEEAKQKLGVCIAALDSLLATIPEDDMVKAKRIVQALSESTPAPAAVQQLKQQPQQEEPAAAAP